jgi:hypothetical protein
MAAEAAARALFDAEEAASYAAHLDARAEEQGVLDTARAATCLRGELREELHAEGSGASGTEDEYVHLDNDNLDTEDLSYLELPTDEEAAKSAAEQKALMSSSEMQRRDEAARRLMAAERRAGADDQAAAHQSACQSAYLRNLATADEVRAVAAERRPREDRTRVEAKRRLQYDRARAAELARVREHQYPLPSYYVDARIVEDAQHRRQQLRGQATMAAPAVSAWAASAPSSSR